MNAFVALGANLGDAAATLEQAVQRIGALPTFSDHVHHISPSNCRAESRSGRLLISWTMDKTRAFERR